jgi:hypothetical protein
MVHWPNQIGDDQNWPLEANMSGKKLDIDGIMEAAEQLPESPRNAIITKADRASMVLYLVAGICAWQIGQWWGLGMVLTLFLSSMFDGFVHEQHREELIEMHGKLMLDIALKSDILDDKLPAHPDS